MAEEQRRQELKAGNASSNGNLKSQNKAIGGAVIDIVFAIFGNGTIQLVLRQKREAVAITSKKAELRIETNVIAKRRLAS